MLHFFLLLVILFTSKRVSLLGPTSRSFHVPGENEHPDLLEYILFYSIRASSLVKRTTTQDIQQRIHGRQKEVVAAYANEIHHFFFVDSRERKLLLLFVHILTHSLTNMDMIPESNSFSCLLDTLSLSYSNFERTLVLLLLSIFCIKNIDDFVCVAYIWQNGSAQIIYYISYLHIRLINWKGISLSLSLFCCHTNNSCSSQIIIIFNLKKKIRKCNLNYLDHFYCKIK